MRTMTDPSARSNKHALLANTFHHISPTAIVKTRQKTRRPRPTRVTRGM